VLFFLMYVTVAFAGTFFLAATIEMASIRIQGGDPVIRDGLSKAWEKKGKLLGWAIIAATVGILLRALRDRARGLAQIAGALLELGWSIATFFAVPVLVFEEIGPIGAVRRSGEIVKQTWGEAAGGVVSVNLIVLVAALLGAIPIALGAAVSTTALLIGFAVSVVYWIVLAATNSAVDGILKAALFYYADTGNVPDGFENVDLAAMDA
jgi:hypothetical protein